MSHFCGYLSSWICTLCFHIPVFVEKYCRNLIFFVLLPFHIFCTSFWNNSYIEALAIQHYTHFFKFNRVVFIDKKRYTATFNIYFNIDFLANKKRLSWEWKTSPNIDFCMFQEFSYLFEQHVLWKYTIYSIMFIMPFIGIPDTCANNITFLNSFIFIWCNFGGAHKYFCRWLVREGML